MSFKYKTSTVDGSSHEFALDGYGSTVTTNLWLECPGPCGTGAVVFAHARRYPGHSQDIPVCSNEVRVAAVRTTIRLDVNGDDTIDGTDDTQLQQVSPDHGVIYGAETGKLHKVSFKSEGGIPYSSSSFIYRLTLKGPDGAFKLRPSGNSTEYVSSPGGTDVYVSPLFSPPSTLVAETAYTLECLQPAQGEITYCSRSQYPDEPIIPSSHTVKITATDIRLYTDTDNDGTIDEKSGGEREFAQYAPGRLLVMRGTNVTADVAMYPSPRAETRFSLKPDALKQSGTVTLSAVEGNDKVEVWDAQTDGTKLTLPVTYDPPSDAPQTLWVSGVSTGTAVLAVSYEFSNSQIVSNLTAFTAIPPISVAPAISNAYVWCSLPSLGTNDGVRFEAELKNQGYKVEWFTDDDGHTNSVNFFGCTLANYKKMATGGAITIISHGMPGEHLAVYAPYTSAGALACTNWCAGETGMYVDSIVDTDPVTGTTNYIKSYYYVGVETSWLEKNWKQTLSNNNAIVMWSICYSASNCPTAGISVKEAAGGRWRSGYELPTAEDEASDVNEAFLQRMNGTLSNGVLRTAGSAYNDPTIDYTTIYKRLRTFPPPPAVDYEYLDWNGVNWIYRPHGSVRMDGSPWTTLCPAPLEIVPTYPTSAVTEKRKGFGCILLDTALSNILPATDAVVKESGGATIPDTYWLKDSEGRFYGVGFTFDKTSDNSTTTMKAVSDKIKNQGTEGRAMDGNRVQPNTDDKQWSF